MELKNKQQNQVQKENKPTQEWAIANIKCTQWDNTISNDQGESYTRTSFTLQKRYFDKKLGEWKNGNTYDVKDLLVLQRLIEKAFQQVTKEE